MVTAQIRHVVTGELPGNKIAAALHDSDCELAQMRSLFLEADGQLSVCKA